MIIWASFQNYRCLFCFHVNCCSTVPSLDFLLFCVWFWSFALQVFARALQPTTRGGEPAEVQHHEVQGRDKKLPLRHEKIANFFTKFVFLCTYSERTRGYFNLYCTSSTAFFDLPQTALERRKNSSAYGKSNSSPLTGVLSAKQGENTNLSTLLHQQKAEQLFCKGLKASKIFFLTSFLIAKLCVSLSFLSP